MKMMQKLAQQIQHNSVRTTDRVPTPEQKQQHQGQRTFEKAYSSPDPAPPPPPPQRYALAQQGLNAQRSTYATPGHVQHSSAPSPFFDSWAPQTSASLPSTSAANMRMRDDSSRFQNHHQNQNGQRVWR